MRGRRLHELTAGAYLTPFGGAEAAAPYLERDSALDAALGTSQPKSPRRRRLRPALIPVALAA